jgi:uncharacterized membrane protein YebE (DUF533 family)|tara:strand:- start:1820 stop:2074 length:255 start_codon:yes stop_codon:yes gene_type:complete
MNGMLDEIVTIVSLLGAGALMAYLVRNGTCKKKKPEQPPRNTAADAATEAIQESFEEELVRVRSATTGDTPADDLADLGNTRRR